MRRPDNSALQRYLLFLSAGICLLYLWWAAVLQNQTVRQIWVVESSSEEMTFTAEKGQTILEGIGLCADDPDAAAEGTESLSISGTIHILSSGGAVIWQTSYTNLEVPVLQIQEIEGLLEDVIELTEGETYTLLLYDTSMDPITDITWSFYGKERGLGTLYVCISIGVLALLSVLYWSGWKKKCLLPIPMHVVLIGGCSALMVFLAFCCLPEETEELKEAYALSNLILENIAGTEELSGLVPSGVMRAAGTADAQSLYLFWAGGDYGNVSMDAADFVQASYGFNVRALIPALGLTLARILKLSYQWYLILPRLMNAAFYIVFLVLMMLLCPEMRLFLGSFSLLPSTLSLINSFSSSAWDVTFSMVFMCMFAQVINCSKGRERAIWLWMAFSTVTLFLPFYIEANLLQEPAGSGIEWVWTAPWRLFLSLVRTLISSGETILEIFTGRYAGGQLSFWLIAGIVGAFLLIASGSAAGDKGGSGFASVLLKIGIVIVIFSALITHTDTDYFYNHTMIEGIQGSDFLPLLLWTPFLVPASKRAAENLREAQLLQCGLTVLYMLSWFSGTLLGMG